MVAAAETTRVWDVRGHGWQEEKRASLDPTRCPQAAAAATKTHEAAATNRHFKKKKLEKKKKQAGNREQIQLAK